MAYFPPVLVVEDEESDALLLQLAMKEAGVPNKLVFARDGQELIDCLSCKSPSNGKFPALLLLDLKMPRMDGFQVLSWIQARPEFHALPIIIFSASACPSDIQKALQMGAVDYLEKPSQYARLVELARVLRQRWLSVSASAVPAAASGYSPLGARTKASPAKSMHA